MVPCISFSETKKAASYNSVRRHQDSSKTKCYKYFISCLSATPALRHIPPTGHVSIVVSTHVSILLWSVKPQDEKALDRYEGYPVFYEKADMPVELDSKTVNAFVYVMTEGHQLGMPSQRYVNTIAEGYQSAGFDTAVLEDAIAETEQRMAEEPQEEQQNLFGFGGMKGW